VKKKTFEVSRTPEPHGLYLELFSQNSRQENMTTCVWLGWRAAGCSAALQITDIWRPVSPPILAIWQRRCLVFLLTNVKICQCLNKHVIETNVSVLTLLKDSLNSSHFKYLPGKNTTLQLQFFETLSKNRKILIKCNSLSSKFFFKTWIHLQLSH
jgi:hypothetical protein